MLLKRIQLYRQVEFYQTRPSKGQDPSSGLHLCWKFLFDQVHQVAVEDPLGHVLSWSVGQKDHRFRLFRLYAVRRFQYSPYDLTSPPQIPSEAGTRLFDLRQVTRHSQLNALKRSDQQQLKKVQHSRMTTQYSLWGIYMNTSETTHGPLAHFSLNRILRLQDCKNQLFK